MELAVAVPHNVLEGVPDEREKVRKIGYLARAAAMFRVSRFIIYVYGQPSSDLEILRKYLEYLVTPPYLRKILFPKDPALRLAGLLPPLNIPSHVLPPEPKPGEVRPGVVVKHDGYYSMLYIGGDKYAKVPRPYPLKTVMLVRIEAPTHRPDTYRASVYRGEPPMYMGFKVEVRHVRELFAENFDTIILTGKEGRSICETRLRPRGRILVVFGGPRHGVDEILRMEGISVDAPMINFVPMQGLETIRTEEAMIAVLSILNTYLVCKR